jgi:glycosyltransferase involved in cell wall biosynthesis
MQKQAQRPHQNLKSSSKRILAYMDWNSPTGFGNVSKNIIDRIIPFCLENKVVIDICAINYRGESNVTYKDCVNIFNAKDYAKDNKDTYLNRTGFLTLLSLRPYDVVWMMYDVNVITPLLPTIKQLKLRQKNITKKGFKTILYTPIDSPPEKTWFNGVNDIDELITYTNYGLDEIEKVFKFKKPIQIIPHGLETETYKPMDKDGLRKKYGIPEDCMVIGTVNKNQPRKDIGCTLISFAKFKKNYQSLAETYTEGKRAVLYLHTYHSDPSGINVHQVASRLGLVFNQDYFLPIEPRYSNAEFTPEDLNEVYNCFDVFVSTSSAEGWGLTVTEAMSTGLPVVCGNHTSLKEITRNGKDVHAIYGQHEHIQIHDGGAVRYCLDADQVANEFLLLFIRYIEQGCFEINDYTYQKSKYNWDKIAQSWTKVLNKIL